MRLIFTSGSREGQSVDLDGVRVMIGRVEDNDLQLPDEKVSRHHAVIEQEDGGRVVLRDLNSRNGTYVDGVRLAGSRVLTGGEQLRLGGAQLRVEAGSVPGRGAAPPPKAVLPARRLRDRRAVLSGIAAAVAVIVIVVAQLVLPGVGEHSLRSDLAPYGPVRHVRISSLPAIKLLWHRADRVNVSMDSYRSEPGGHGSLADFLSRTRSAGKLDARVGLVEAQLVTLHDVRLHKDGDALLGEARLTQKELSAALPTFVGIRPISASQNGIVVRARASAVGRTATVRLRVLADGGKVVVQPDGLPFGSLASIHVFNDPRVYVESLGAKLQGDQYLITARARLE
jgi:FHA domain